MAPLVSVILPVYNMAAYLEKCLLSLQNQSYRRFEVLVVDDCSSDNSLSLAQGFAARDERFRILTQPRNQGVSAARNLGLKRSRGELICFCDPDDWCEPDYLQSFVEQLRDPTVALAVTGFYTDQKITRGRKQSPAILNQRTMLPAILKLTGNVRGFLWNKCFRRHIITAHQLQFDQKLTLMEDYLFIVQYALTSQVFAYDQKPRYHYVQHRDSAVHSIDLKMVRNIISAWTRAHAAILHSLLRPGKRD